MLLISKNLTARRDMLIGERLSGLPRSITLEGFKKSRSSVTDDYAMPTGAKYIAFNRLTPEIRVNCKSYGLFRPLPHRLLPPFAF